MDGVKSMIMNFKKPLNQKGQGHFKYKGIEIDRIAKHFKTAIPELSSPDTILVPIPPSKSRSHPDYDDRGVRLLQRFCEGRPHEDIRDMISSRQTVVASHDRQDRPRPEEILENLELDPKQCVDQKPRIVLFDDLITTGAHFKACKELLTPAFPNSTIEGLFIARRNIKRPSLDEIFDINDFF